MAVTEAPPDAPEAAEAASGGEQAAPAGGLAGVLGSGEHLAVGRLWVLGSLLYLLVAAVAGGLVGAERLDTGDTTDLLEDAFGQVFSLHSTAGVFLFLIPLFIGIATAVVPLQIGASTIAFPRAAAAAFWAWFLSGAVLLGSYVIDGGPSGGELDGILLWLVSLGGVIVALCLGTVCVVTTVWALRTGGMRLERVPAFSWSMLVAGSVWLVSLPVLLGLVVLAYVDTRYGSGLFGEAGIYERFRWALGSPQVFVYALPALGLLVDAVPVAAGVRQRNHGVLLAALAVAGVLGFGADGLAHAVDPSILQDVLYVGGAFLLVLPLLVIAGGVADTLRRGRLRLTGPLLFGISALLMILAGAAANALRVVDNLDLTGTTADSSVVHYALLGGAIGGFGALHHWATKLFGVELRETVGRAAAVLLLLGTVALALPDLVSGFLDQSFGSVGTFRDGVEALNAVSLVGGVIIVFGVLLLLANLAGAAAGLRKGAGAPADPWDGHTLEWATASPPERGNFGPLAEVTSPAPLLDQKEAEAVEAEPVEENA